MNNLYTPILLFLFILLSGLNCHNRPAPAAEPVSYDYERPITWNELKIQSAEIDSNLSILDDICSTFESKATKKKIPRRELIELIAPGGTQRTFIFNDTTLQK